MAQVIDEYSLEARGGKDKRRLAAGDGARIPTDFHAPSGPRPVGGDRAETKSGTATEPDQKGFIVSPSIVRVRNLNDRIETIHNRALTIKSIITDDKMLAKYSQDWNLMQRIDIIVNSNSTSDEKLTKLRALLELIRKYDTKLVDAIEDYFKNKKELDDTLKFIYTNLNPEGIRKLKINIDIVLQKIAVIRKEEVGKAIYERLLLLWNIFHQISMLEKVEIIEEQKRFLLGWIRVIEKGVKDGKWTGFLGSGGFYSRLDSYMEAFEKRYANKTFAEMLRRNKAKYGESNPQAWLGDEFHPEQWPDSLWYMYKNIDAIAKERISRLWGSALKVAESLRSIIEKEFGKSPTAVLERVKKRIEVFKRRILREWSAKRKEFKNLFIELIMTIEIIWNVVKKIEERDESYLKSKTLASSIRNNVRYGEIANKVVSSANIAGTPSLQHASYLALTLKMFGDNKKTQNDVWESLKNPSDVDQKLIDEFNNSINSVARTYRKFQRFVQSLGLVYSTQESYIATNR